MAVLRIHRHTLTCLRTYTTSVSSSASITPSPAAQRAFLRHRDQHLLLDTLSHTKALTAHIQKIATHLRTHHPATIEPPPGSNLSQPYILGRQRLKLGTELSVAEARVVQNAERIGEHLTDLMFEPYPSYHDPNGERAANPHMVFEDKVARMSHAERREQLAQIRLEEDAVAGRLKRETESMKRKVEEVQRMLEQRDGKRAGGTETEVKVERPASLVFTRMGESVVRKTSSSWSNSSYAPKAEEVKAAPPQTTFSALKQGLVDRVGPVVTKAETKAKSTEAGAKATEVKPVSSSGSLKALRRAEYGQDQAKPVEAKATPTEVKAKPAEVKPAPARSSLMDMQKRIDELNKIGSG